MGIHAAARAIVYVVVACAVNIQGLLCCSYVSDTDDTEPMYGDAIEITESQYCFENECTIRIKESNILLNIINKTGDWITATNTTHLFTFPTNGSEATCISNSNAHTPAQFHFSLALFIISVIIDCIGIAGSIITIGLHLIFKRLQTASGVLVIMLCLFIGIINVVGCIYNITLYYQLNVPGEFCAFVSYVIIIIFGDIYKITKSTILFNFVRVMYRSYRLSGKPNNEKKLLCKYIAFIIGATTVSSTIIILVDVFGSRKGFSRTMSGQCILIFEQTNNPSELPVIILYVFHLIVWIIVEIVAVTIGFILYFINTRQCCVIPTSRDFRVFILLLFTVGFDIVAFLVLIRLGVSSTIASLVNSTGTAIEQVGLFILFATTSKVLNCLHMKDSQSSNTMYL